MLSDNSKSIVLAVLRIVPTQSDCGGIDLAIELDVAREQRGLAKTSVIQSKPKRSRDSTDAFCDEVLAGNIVPIGGACLSRDLWKLYTGWCDRTRSRRLRNGQLIARVRERPGATYRRRRFETDGNPAGMIVFDESLVNAENGRIREQVEQFQASVQRYLGERAKAV